MSEEIQPYEKKVYPLDRFCVVRQFFLSQYFEVVRQEKGQLIS
jgi:hypothetical protein